MKKRKSGGGANWMDTYGDMVTLLLCFFVLLYSMSTISEEKWQALVMSFNPEATPEVTETTGNEGPVADKLEEDEETSSGVMTQAQVDETMNQLYEQIQNMVAENANLDENENISVFKDGGKVYISFNQTVFFDGYSSELRKESHEVLDQVSEILDSCAPAIEEVQVLGHTAQVSGTKDDNPRVDRTLSSQRATNVVIYVQEQAKVLDPARLLSVGAGKWRPVASNDTAEGRAKNRRVEMIISGRDLENELQSGSIQEFNTGTGNPPSGTLPTPNLSAPPAEI